MEEEREEALILEYLRGEASQTEHARLREWMKAHPAHEAAARQVAQMYYARRTKERIRQRDSQEAFRRTMRRRKGKKRRLFVQRLSVVAACMALVVLPVVNYYYFLSQRKAEQALITVQTNAGVRTRLNLPDGTEVHLNASGRLTYPASFGPEERGVTLEGEGYFQVAHDAKRPFIVLNSESDA